MASTPRLPRNLSTASRRFWRSIMAKYELREDELRLLEDACREMDLIERFEAQLATTDLVVAGSQGQPVASPLAQEVRQHRSVLARLLKQLELPSEGGAAAGGSRSAAGRSLAAARWGGKAS